MGQGVRTTPVDSAPGSETRRNLSSSATLPFRSKEAAPTILGESAKIYKPAREAKKSAQHSPNPEIGERRLTSPPRRR